MIDEDALATAVAEDAFTGLIVVDVGERRALEQAHGFAHRAHHVPVTAGTRFGIASGAKSFTALVVMRLVEDRALRLEDPVRRLLGTDLPLIDDGVTVDHLLTHTSGMGDYLDEEADWDVDDYVLPVPVHLLGKPEAFVPVQRRRRHLHDGGRPPPILAGIPGRPDRLPRDGCADDPAAPRRARGGHALRHGLLAARHRQRW